MLLKELLKNIEAVEIYGEIESIDISKIAFSSLEIIDNSLFVAIKGYKTDGHKYINDAVNKGATVVVVEDKEFTNDLDKKIVVIVVDNSRKTLAELSTKFYKEPSKKLKLVGVTGTKGKTTTTYYIKNIFEKAGYKTGLIGSIKNMIGEKEISTKLTTPESLTINSLMNDMVSEGCTHCVMEVSSHSLELYRVYGLDFDVAVFTNITSDHMDFHSDFENYLNTKKILFDDLKENSTIVCNADDDSSDRIIKDSKAKVIKYSSEKESDVRFSNVEYNLNGTAFNVLYNNTNYSIKTKLVGKFNAYNASSAFGAAVALQIEPKIVAEGINTTPQVTGRFEVVSSKNKKVIVDYSHTSDSIEKALNAVNHIVKGKQKVYCLIGCGGDRDTTKRPIMGRIASDNSDIAIITSDNPRTEDPIKIIEDILPGIKKDNFKVLVDREVAIKFAIESSPDDAVILIAGKGHEDYQEINGERFHFSDKEMAEKYLRNV